MNFRKINERVENFLQAQNEEADLTQGEKGIKLSGDKKDVSDLIQKLDQEYGDLTIPEFIDMLIQKEKSGEGILDENLNEHMGKYSSYNVSYEFSKFLIPLIKKDYKNIKIETYQPADSISRPSLYIKQKATGEEFGSFIGAEFNQKSEQTNSWVICWGSINIYDNTRINPVAVLCKELFPDYEEYPSSKYSWDHGYFYTKTTLGRRTQEGNKEAIKELVDQLNDIFSTIDAKLKQSMSKVDSELEELERARAQAKSNKVATATTVGKALSKSSIAKKIQALKNPTPEQLARILAAIGEQ